MSIFLFFFSLSFHFSSHSSHTQNMLTPSSHTHSLPHSPPTHTPTVVTDRRLANRARSLVPRTPWPRLSVSTTTSTRSCISLSLWSTEKALPIDHTQLRTSIIFNPFHNHATHVRVVIYFPFPYHHHYVYQKKKIQLNHDYFYKYYLLQTDRQ